MSIKEIAVNMLHEFDSDVTNKNIIKVSNIRKIQNVKACKEYKRFKNNKTMFYIIVGINYIDCPFPDYVYTVYTPFAN